MKWYIKEFSTLTNISVRMLRYYDKMNVLKPSIRLDNGYRLYSETDLMRLQQIMALKFFGFPLKQMVSLKSNILENFIIQKKALEEKQMQMQYAIHTLNNVIQDFEQHQTVDWKQIIKLMEDYQMIKKWTQELEKILNSEEMKQVSQLINGGFDEDYDLEWSKLSKEVSAHLQEDPLSETGKIFAKKWMDLVHQIYTPEYRSLGRAIWEKGYKTGKLQNDHYSKAVVNWISKAIEHYYSERTQNLFAEMKVISPKNGQVILKKWNSFMEELYGTDSSAKDAFYKQYAPMDIQEWFKKAK